MSQPVTGSVKEAIAIDKATNRRASEGKKNPKSSIEILHQSIFSFF